METMHFDSSVSPVRQNQDHYAVLGLANLRYKATQRQIKAARK